jgi:DNA-binding IclR family transcriptional regulator
VRHGNSISARANREAVRKNPDTKESNYIQNKGGGQMANATFMKVQDVADELGVSKSYAYKIVQKLNAELKEQGFLTISGRVNKQYFLERTCYGSKKKGD